MSVTKRMKDERKPGNSQNKKKGTSLFYSFKPDQEQVNAILDFGRDWSEVVSELSNVVREDTTLKVAYDEKSGAYYATLIERVEWPEPAKGLSVWHADPVKALLGVLFAATQLWPGFPEVDWPPGSPVSGW